MLNKDTNLRSIIKGISWRILATTTTIIIVYSFFNRLDLAIATGLVETVLKVGLYWAHERAWIKVKWGRKKIGSFNIYLTGVLQLEKVRIADKVYSKLLKLDIPVEIIGDKEINCIIPNIQNARESKRLYFERIGNFIQKLQNNSISTVLSFSEECEESKDIIREILKTNIFVCIIDSNKKGTNTVENVKYEIIIDLSISSEDEAVSIILEYVKNKIINVKMD